MRKMHMTNSRVDSITIIVEPIADRYLIESGKSVIIEYDHSDLDLEIDLSEDGDIQIWTHGPTRVFSGEDLLPSLG